jgi:hypothetical protein
MSNGLSALMLAIVAGHVEVARLKSFRVDLLLTQFDLLTRHMQRVRIKRPV